MKKTIVLTFTIILFSLVMFAQNVSNPKETKIYNPLADAKSDIESVIKKAKAEGKHVLLQLGGNWCGWCILFDKKVKESDILKSTMDKNYIVYHVNYDTVNKNEEVFASLGYPQRFGFPVFVILDGDGNRLHTQNSAYLEEGKGHSEKKILNFFKHWSPEALNPVNYK